MRGIRDQEHGGAQNHGWIGMTRSRIAKLSGRPVAVGIIVVLILISAYTIVFSVSPHSYLKMAVVVLSSPDSVNVGIDLPLGVASASSINVSQVNETDPRWFRFLAEEYPGHPGQASTFSLAPNEARLRIETNGTIVLGIEWTGGLDSDPMAWARLIGSSFHYTQVTNQSEHPAGFLLISISMVHGIIPLWGECFFAITSTDGIVPSGQQREFQVTTVLADAADLITLDWNGNIALTRGSFPTYAD